MTDDYISGTEVSEIVAALTPVLANLFPYYGVTKTYVALLMIVLDACGLDNTVAQVNSLHEALQAHRD